MCDGVCVQAPRGKAGDACNKTCTEGEWSSGCSGPGQPKPGLADCYTNEGLYCDNDSGVCEALPKAGDPCQPGACSPGTFCGKGEVCRSTVALGTECLYEDACGVDAFCDLGTTNVCVAKKPVGADCVE